jgi:hypothetical protein
MQVIDSSTWTGVPSDPFAELTSSERVGELRFERRRWRLILQLAPFTLIVLAAIAQIVRYGAQFRSITDFSSALDNYKILGGFVVGLGLLLLGLFLVRFLASRIKRISRTAPLIIGSKELIAGTGQRHVAFENMTDMKLEHAGYVKGSLIEHLHRQPLWSFRGKYGPLPVVKILIKNDEPLVLDLATLSGQPDRIVRILAYRIENAQSKKTSKNV